MGIRSRIPSHVQGLVMITFIRSRIAGRVGLKFLVPLDLNMHFLCSFTQYGFKRKHCFPYLLKNVKHDYMSCVMRKPAFCICKNKDVDQL